MTRTGQVSVERRKRVLLLKRKPGFVAVDERGQEVSANGVGVGFELHDGSPFDVVMGLDAECNERAQCKTENDSKKDVNGTGAHGECFGLDVAKMIGIHADGAKEC
jgi:hypothetical protein